MATEFYLPDIGEGLTEATVISWYAEIGAEVGLDEPLVELETDKAVVDVPAPVAGVLLHQGARPGETILVDSLLAVVGEPGEDWAPAKPAQEAAPIVGRLEEAGLAPPVSAGARPQALPRVRRLAVEMGVDLGAVTGSGPGGRITEDDVVAASGADRGPVQRIPMSATRRTIAANMSRSWREIPHVTTFGSADAAALLERREAHGRVPLEALLIHRVVPLLQRFPVFNATVAGNEVVHKMHYDVGFAVDTDAGLAVAVIRGADGLDVAGLAAEVERLASAVRGRTATPDELGGQTFTISNIGAVGGGFGTPIVPYGTSAILSIGRAELRPSVRDREVVARREFPLSMSYDHRIIDGAAGRAFMSAVVEAIEAG